MKRTRQIALVVGAVLAVGWVATRYLNNRIEHSWHFLRASTEMAEMIRAKKLDPECLMDAKRISGALEKLVPIKTRDLVVAKVAAGNQEILTEIIEEIQPEWIAMRTFHHLLEDVQKRATWWQRTERTTLSGINYVMRTYIDNYPDYLASTSGAVTDFVYGPEVNSQMRAIEQACRLSPSLYSNYSTFFFYFNDGFK